ncbi:putative sulfate exporter family transporter [Streptomyces sp. NPDC005402]|uniref:YeiH family protein n=1 Tax=Streptomyces sp. NPDC005402 TaxID=3155338 RepID=UPI0033B441B9
MEPSYALLVKPLPQRALAGTRRTARAVGAKVPGLAVALTVALPATWLGRLVPTVGGPVFGIVVGALAGALLGRGAAPGRAERLRPGYAFVGRQVLQASIIVLGAGLPLSEVLHVGAGSLPVMLGTLAVALGGARVVGGLLGVHRETGLLIGVGTGVCGASAIAAVTAAVDAAEARVAYALGTIFTFNIAAVLLFPPIGHLLGLSQEAFGLWSGTAINDTSSVVAAAYSYGTEAGAYAVVVKLTRSLMIVPICAVLVMWRTWRRRAIHVQPNETTSGRIWRAFPLFVIGFLAASALATCGGIPASWQLVLPVISTFLITLALSGIGLSLKFSQLREAGPRPLLLGAILWIVVGVTGVALQAITGRL